MEYGSYGTSALGSWYGGGGQPSQGSFLNSLSGNSGGSSSWGSYGSGSNGSWGSQMPQQQDGFSLSKMGDYADTASKFAQPIALGLNAYSTFFGQGKEAHDKNMKVLDQQIAGNKDKLQRRSALNAAWAKTEREKAR